MKSAKPCAAASSCASGTVGDRPSAVRNSFVHSFLAKGRLLYTHDETIAALCATLHEMGERDREIALFRAATNVLPPLYKAHKWMLTRGDANYAALRSLFDAAIDGGHARRVGEALFELSSYWYLRPHRGVDVLLGDGEETASAVAGIVHLDQAAGFGERNPGL